MSTNMRVYYNDAGKITFTVIGSAKLNDQTYDYIEVPYQDMEILEDWQVIDQDLVYMPDLVSIQDRARKHVNTYRGLARLQFITVEPGQDMVYLDKERQAVEFINTQDPDIDDFPAIKAEIGSTAPTAYEVAQVYINLAAIWRHASAIIEGVSMAAHAQIDNATDVSTCQTVIDTFADTLDDAMQDMWDMVP